VTCVHFENLRVQTRNLLKKIEFHRLCLRLALSLSGCFFAREQVELCGWWSKIIITAFAYYIMSNPPLVPFLAAVNPHPRTECVRPGPPASCRLPCSASQVYMSSLISKDQTAGSYRVRLGNSLLGYESVCRSAHRGQSRTTADWSTGCNVSCNQETSKITP